MTVIRYTKTYFREPRLISEDAYNSIRLQLMRNPNSEVDPYPETFSQHFSGLLKGIGISFFLALFCFGVFEDGNPMIAVGGISMVTFFACLVYLFLEGPSYATFVKQKKGYYERMKSVIQYTSSYKEFVALFYR